MPSHSLGSTLIDHKRAKWQNKRGWDYSGNGLSSTFGTRFVVDPGCTDRTGKYRNYCIDWRDKKPTIIVNYKKFYVGDKLT